MLSKKFQSKIYDTYKQNHENTVRHGQYEYSIAYNGCANIHTWIIRRFTALPYEDKWHWLQPLDMDIKEGM